MIRVSKGTDRPQAVTYIVGEVDAIKAIEIIRIGVSGVRVGNIQDFGRVSEELIKALSLAPGQFVAIDGVKHVSQQQQPHPVSRESK